jgi:uncharacterized protein with HEPN domain
MRNDRERLLDMLDAIERIERHAAGGREAFEQDELIQTWVVHHLQIVGEAAAKLGRQFHVSHPQIPWAEVTAMRNVLVHDYFGIDLKAVLGSGGARPPRLEGQAAGVGQGAQRGILAAVRAPVRRVVPSEPPGVKLDRETADLSAAISPPSSSSPPGSHPPS